MDIFKNMGQFAGLLGALPRIKEEVDKLQQTLGQLTAEATAGGGMVTVKVNGRMEMVSCSLSEEVLRLNDREMLEDLIRAATNQAIERVRGLVAQESSKVLGGLGLPPGMGLPGMP
jgi:DNA-binding YbaB/EbfC family protein